MKIWDVLYEYFVCWQHFLDVQSEVARTISAQDLSKPRCKNFFKEYIVKGNYIQNSCADSCLSFLLKIKQSNCGKLLKEIRDQRGTT